MATDKRLDQVSQLTDFDYALIVKGDQVAKASKQQLAELVGDLLYGATNATGLASVVAGLIVPVSSSFGVANKRVLTRDDDANNLTDGRYSYIDADVPVNAVGYNATLFQFTTEGRTEDKYQIVFEFNNDAVYLRMHKIGVGWRDWKKLLSFI